MVAPKATSVTAARTDTPRRVAAYGCRGGGAAWVGGGEVSEELPQIPGNSAPVADRGAQSSMHQDTRTRTRRRPPPGPHDALFRSIFGTPVRAAELLCHLVPARWARCIEWPSLRAVDRSFVDAGLRGRQADLIFVARLKGSRTLVYLLLEHKSG